MIERLCLSAPSKLGPMALEKSASWALNDAWDTTNVCGFELPIGRDGSWNHASHFHDDEKGLNATTQGSEGGQSRWWGVQGPPFHSTTAFTPSTEPHCLSRKNKLRHLTNGNRPQ